MNKFVNKILKDNKILLNKVKKKKMTVATDCSGIETPIYALRQLKIPYSHIFSSDIDKSCQKFIKENHNPNEFYEDLRKRNNNKYKNKSIDIYVAGFPCQTFSSLGSYEGFENKEKGKIFFHIYDFLVKNQPKVFILENVRTLVTHDKGKTFKIIMKMLKKLKNYDIEYKILNTNNYNIPQSRNRIYIVGIKKSVKKRKFVFPDNLDLKNNIDDILTKQTKKEKLLPRHKILYSEITKKYKDINSKNKWILNLNVSTIDWFRRGQTNMCPCLVTYCNYYITHHKRYLTPNEALLFQGILPKDLKKFKNFNNNQICKFAGNCMSINVLISLFCKSFYENVCNFCQWDD